MIDFSQYNGVKGIRAQGTGDISSPFLQPSLLTPIDPDKALAESMPVIGATTADVIPAPAVQTDSNPFGDIVVNGRPDRVDPITRQQAVGPVRVDDISGIALPTVGMSESAPRIKRDPGNPSGQSGRGIGDIIGRLILGGTADESTLDPATQKAKQSKRKSAGNASASFANDPEAAAAGFMQAPGTDGDSLGSTISKIAKMFSGL
jgi:hypothetical protein